MSDRKKPKPKKGQDPQPKKHEEVPDIPVPLGPGRCGTSISFAIDLGSLLLDELAVHVSNRIIDISANCTSNDGIPVQLSRRRAIAKGYTINAIAIPHTMRGIKHDLAGYFAQNVIGGPNAFVIVPVTKRDYASALRRKLVVEIGMSAKPPIARRRG
jgi:hypothetical protein